MPSEYFTMTFEGADTADYLSGLVTLTVEIIGAPPRRENVADTFEGWDYYLHSPVAWRRGVRVIVRRAKVETEDDGTDFGDVELLLDLLAKPHTRITACTSTRTTRSFAAGARGSAELFWSGSRLPMTVRYAGHTLGQFSGGREALTLELIAPDIM